jgi:hypothetical protein
MFESSALLNRGLDEGFKWLINKLIEEEDESSSDE